jgi:molybdopterin adenylyltransferase
MIKVISVNLSEKKGTIKTPVPEIILDSQGVMHDAHAGSWHRQVSLLGKESFDKFASIAGRTFAWGEFAENITTEGIVLYKCHPFDRLKIGEVELEVTQIGKKCHGESCAIFLEVGNCVMPKEGIFCRVVKPGIVRAGDSMEYFPKVMKVLVVTLSDRVSQGIYPDKSGPGISERVRALFRNSGWPAEVTNHCIPDEAVMLEKLIAESAGMYDVILTTGGTGLGPRDITVETLQRLLDKEIPGIMEQVRMTYGGSNPNALLSRSVAGLIGVTPVFALPGSFRAVNEYMDVIEKVLVHLIFMVQGIDLH